MRKKLSGFTDAGRFTERGSSRREIAEQYTESTVGAEGLQLSADELRGSV
jgi:hypothetical protein